MFCCWAGGGCENKRTLLSSMALAQSSVCSLPGTLLVAEQIKHQIKVVLQKEFSGEAEEGILSGNQAYLTGAVKLSLLRTTLSNTQKKINHLFSY